MYLSLIIIGQNTVAHHVGIVLMYKKVEIEKLKRKRSNMDKKKKLKMEYKEMKTPMGAIIIKNSINGKVFLDVSKDTKSKINRHRFQLKSGLHNIKELQKDWNELGEDAFSIEVLEELKYDEKEENKDYTEELEIMKVIWQERLKEDKTVKLYEK